MSPEFWRGRRVLVTGHTGFKGSWLSLWLQKLGAAATGFGLRPQTTPSLFDAAEVDCGMVSIENDVRDLEALVRTFQAHRPEIVFHLAAQALVRSSYENPVDTYSTNVMGTVNLLEAARRVGCARAIVIVTSDKCYANDEGSRSFLESDALGGRDPYSSSKACADLVTSAYVASFFCKEDYQTHGIGAATARAGNVIGGGDWARDRLLPDVVRALMAGEPIVIRNPHATRPWQYVLEPLRGYMELAEALASHGPDFSGAWNFGPAADDTRTVSWVVERAVRQWGGGARWELDAGSQAHEAQTLRLDSSKAKSRLGWEPILALPNALDGIVSWYRDYYRYCSGARASARSLATREIAHYEGLLPC